jgi:uncharacterized CHY-type Zn-finger protein
VSAASAGRGVPPVFGSTIDDETRCIHYGTPVDVIAISFFCCRRYYPCHLCHAEAETHAPVRWPEARWNEPAILCGVCRSELSVTDYLAVSACPSCTAEFNEGCRLHSHLYFDTPPQK